MRCSAFLDPTGRLGSMPLHRSRDPSRESSCLLSRRPLEPGDQRSEDAISRHSSASGKVEWGLPARRYQWPALRSSPSTRCKWAWTQAEASSLSDWTSLWAVSHSPLPWCHRDARAELSPSGGVSFPTDDLNASISMACLPRLQSRRLPAAGQHVPCSVRTARDRLAMRTQTDHTAKATRRARPGENRDPIFVGGPGKRQSPSR